jgi:fructose-1,6-bisphosphatase II
MHHVLNSLDMDGYIVIGEELKLGLHSAFDTGARIGTGNGPMLDVVTDPIEGRSLLESGRSGAISVCAVAPVGSMWAPQRAVYMEKIIVDAEVAPALVPECMDAPAAWTLALVARLKKKDIHDLVVFVLDRPRHAELVDEIRRAGARVMLRAAGDVAGALLVVTTHGRADILMGIGGVSEGIMAACAVRALGGGMLGRLAPQTDAERQAVDAAGNNHAARMQRRDVNNLRDFFGRSAPERLATEYGPEIWTLYARGLLRVDSTLTGHCEREHRPVDLQAVMREIDDARAEEAARRLRMAPVA